MVPSSLRSSSADQVSRDISRFIARIPEGPHRDRHGGHARDCFRRKPIYPRTRVAAHLGGRDTLPWPGTYKDLSKIVANSIGRLRSPPPAPEAVSGHEDRTRATAM